MRLVQRREHFGFEALGCGNSELQGLFHLALIKAIAFDCFGYFGHASLLVEPGLGALGLQCVEDRR